MREHCSFSMFFPPFGAKTEYLHRLFCTHMELHCSKTYSPAVFQHYVFCTHMELHCSKTQRRDYYRLGKFCTHMELHCSKTGVRLTNNRP